MSAAVGKQQNTGSPELIRELVGCLEAWDASSCRVARLEAGLLVSVHRIQRDPLAGLGTDPYVAEFECGGRNYTCPLYEFQARAQIVDLESAKAVAGRPAQKATAV